jgi:hypothetical protein
MRATKYQREQIQILWLATIWLIFSAGLLCVKLSNSIPNAQAHYSGLHKAVIGASRS